MALTMRLDNEIYQSLIFYKNDYSNNRLNSYSKLFTSLLPFSLPWNIHKICKWHTEDVSQSD